MGLSAHVHYTAAFALPGWAVAIITGVVVLAIGGLVALSRQWWLRPRLVMGSQPTKLSRFGKITPDIRIRAHVIQIVNGFAYYRCEPIVYNNGHRATQTIGILIYIKQEHEGRRFFDISEIPGLPPAQGEHFHHNRDSDGWHTFSYTQRVPVTPGTGVRNQFGFLTTLGPLGVAPLRYGLLYGGHRTEGMLVLALDGVQTA